MSDKSKTHYDIGRGKPPRHSMFQKGRSGNPKGRPQKPRNLKTDLVAELGAHIRVREGDREVKISKQEAFIKSLLARALKGDARASALLIGLMAKLLDVDADAVECGVDPSEKAIIDAYFARRLADAATPSKSASGGREDKSDDDDD